MRGKELHLPLKLTPVSRSIGASRMASSACKPSAEGPFDLKTMPPHTCAHLVRRGAHLSWRPRPVGRRPSWPHPPHRWKAVAGPNKHLRGRRDGRHINSGPVLSCYSAPLPSPRLSGRWPLASPASNRRDSRHGSHYKPDGPANHATYMHIMLKLSHKRRPLSCVLKAQGQSLPCTRMTSTRNPPSGLGPAFTTSSVGPIFTTLNRKGVAKGSLKARPTTPSCLGMAFRHRGAMLSR